MPYFVPPTLPGPSLDEGEPESLRRRLWRYYRQPDIGMNVYLLRDGTVTQHDPLTEAGWAAVDVAFYGGHGPYLVSAAQAAALVAAGYSLFTAIVPPGDFNDWQPDWPPDWGLPG